MADPRIVDILDSLGPVPSGLSPARFRGRHRLHHPQDGMVCQRSRWSAIITWSRRVQGGWRLIAVSGKGVSHRRPVN